MGTCCKNSEGNKYNYCDYLVTCEAGFILVFEVCFLKTLLGIVCPSLECSLKTQSTTGHPGKISMFLLYFICRQLSSSAMIQKKMASVKILCSLQIQEARRTCLTHTILCHHPDYTFLMEKFWDAGKSHWT